MVFSGNRKLVQSNPERGDALSVLPTLKCLSGRGSGLKTLPGPHPETMTPFTQDKGSGEA